MSHSGPTVRAGLTALLILASAAHAQPAAPLAIPLKPDPPPAIDGDLSEWAGVPAAQILRDAAHVTFGVQRWKDAADLSATVHLAWRPEYLYVAAEVTDDRIRQTERGSGMFKGDHLELYLDTDPQADAGRTALAAGQFQLGFSPGNFGTSGDPQFDLKPEATVFRPVNTPATGILTAARRTTTGYTLEAAVPWDLLGVKPAEGSELGVELAVSDTDGDESRQEKMMTLLAAPWERTRTRLAPAILARADATAVAAGKPIEIFPAAEVKPGEKVEFAFQAPAQSPGREAVLSMQARLDTPKVMGYTAALRLTVNGEPVPVARLLNKRGAMRVDGVVFSPAAGDRFTVPYSPNFGAPDSHPNYALRGGEKLADFEWNLTGLLKPGPNVLAIENTVTGKLPVPLELAGAKLVSRTPRPVKVLAGPPTGPIETHVPFVPGAAAYKLNQEPGALGVTVNGETFRVVSDFSTPDGQWQSSSNRYFNFERQVEQRPEAIVVRDTFTNLTAENLPLMQRHRVAITAKRVWLAGLEPNNLNGATAEPANPTTFATTAKNGLGLLPLDDVFQVHTANYSDGTTIGLSDNSFVLGPKASHTAEWAIVPTSSPDYFAFVNATRRLIDANFPIEGSFAFLRADPKTTGTWTDTQVADFAKNKDAKFLTISLAAPKFGDRQAHGTAFQTLDLGFWKSEAERRRRLAPGTKQLAYYHCFLDATDEAPEHFAADRLLRSDGTQADYGKPIYKLYLPLENNAFGAASAKNVDRIFNDAGLDGVYWDEIEYSAYRYHYGQPWDGVSADIDPKTLQITRLKSSVTLLTQPWRLALAKKILGRGSLIGNGAPYTRSMAQLKFPHFTETGAISNCSRMQLASPIALGDHLTERNEADAYHDMLAALDYGCVYYWYQDTSFTPTYQTLTHYMFPITPVELGHGYIIGRERILTNRSGFFGWGDGSKPEIHVFDGEGCEVTDLKARKFATPTVARTVNQGGKTLTELRLPEGWSAAIVRGN